MDADCLDVLARMHPRAVDVRPLSLANTYTGSREKKAKVEHKSMERAALLRLFELVLQGSTAPSWVYYLDCEQFHLSALFSQLNVKAIVPNWAAKSITTGNKAYQKLDQQKIHVYGAYSHSVIETLCSIPAEKRPQFRFMWIDSCNNYRADQDGEIARVFKYSLLLDTGISVLGLTYMADRDQGPLTGDKKQFNIERDENVRLRVTEHAVLNHFNIELVHRFSYDGVFTLVFTVWPENPNLPNPQGIVLKVTELSNLAYIPYPPDVKVMSMERFEEIRRSPLPPASAEKKIVKARGNAGSKTKRLLLAGKRPKAAQPLRAPKKPAFSPPAYPYLFGKWGKYAHKAGETCHVVQIAYGRTQSALVKPAGSYAQKCETCFPSFDK
jgi:hypothetical protein